MTGYDASHRTSSFGPSITGASAPLDQRTMREAFGPGMQAGVNLGAAVNALNVVRRSHVERTDGAEGLRRPAVRRRRGARRSG